MKGRSAYSRFLVMADIFCHKKQHPEIANYYFLLGVSHIPTLKVFVEDRGANLISPILFTRFFDIEFSKGVIVFDPNRKQPTVSYVHSPDPDVKPVIHVNIGAGSADLVLDSGADVNEISSVVATICKMRNYPMIHVPLGESLGKRKQSTMIGYRVPIDIPGVYHGLMMSGPYLYSRK